jgi:hypothetical protein
LNRSIPPRVYMAIRKIGDRRCVLRFNVASAEKLRGPAVDSMSRK